MKITSVSVVRHWFVLSAIVLSTHSAIAAEIQTIGPDNRPSELGKEADWIDGDLLMRNDQIVAVIARPGEHRDANMTVRGVGGCLIDLTRNDLPSDQLSCFYPTAGRYQFFDPDKIETGETDSGDVFVRVKSSMSLAANGTTATVEYRLQDGEPYLSVITTIEGDDVRGIAAVDGIRADRTFRFLALDNSAVAMAVDDFFRQSYGFETANAKEPAAWSDDRMRQLRHAGGLTVSKDHRKATWTTRIFAANSPLDLLGMTQSAAPQTIRVLGSVGDQPRIKLSITDDDRLPTGRSSTWHVAEDGVSVVHLLPGTYQLTADAIGHQPVKTEIVVNKSSQQYEIQMGESTAIAVNVTDQDGQAIPVKATIYGTGSTPDPDFGLDSGSGSVGNCVYSAAGNFVRSIPPGTYEVVLSHGPEYDALFQDIEVGKAGNAKIDAVLRRVVDTSGWISAELHSHSSPSGDNTSEQLGRVENLLCEHIEFAPCTEHQRIESYDDQLTILGATDKMATCSGMELTGKPLPLNHQNAFPLKWTPHTQDGGGPQTDSDPVAQIARLAMWDDEADKVVQINHPNMKQMIHDRDLDGQDDGGFSKMLDFTDVIEVHPPEDIFLDPQQAEESERAAKIRIHAWMDLIKSGRRIPGVVNTDAHYNWHGSGWLRNWVRCSTDIPSQIDVPEMIDRLESGQIMMSTGPFMTVKLLHKDLDAPAQVGDEVMLSSESAQLAIRIQCANWLDVNRVEVFVDGQRQPELSRTRNSHPSAFGDGVVKFDQQLRLSLPKNDSFIIVAAIGENQQLGRVMGTQFGKMAPVVVSNPIFVNR